jgi:hypothetical protein
MLSGGQVYEIVWAVFAICMGLFGVFFMGLFIKGNVRLYNNLFERTGFSVFKYYASNLDTTSVRLAAYIVSMALLALGIKILLVDVWL